jgi:hypothetical protein
MRNITSNSKFAIFETIFSNLLKKVNFEKFELLNSLNVNLIYRIVSKKYK